MDSTVRCRGHSCTPRHAHPSMIFRACVFVEYPPLVLKSHIFMDKTLSWFCHSAPLDQDFGSSAPLCLSATPISSRQLHSPAFNQSGSIKTAAVRPPHCQSVLCMGDPLVVLPSLNSGFELCVFLSSQLCFSPGCCCSLRPLSLTLASVFALLVSASLLLLL